MGSNLLSASFGSSGFLPAPKTPEGGLAVVHLPLGVNECGTDTDMSSHLQSSLFGDSPLI